MYPTATFAGYHCALFSVYWYTSVLDGGGHSLFASADAVTAPAAWANIDGTLTANSRDISDELSTYEIPPMSTARVKTPTHLSAMSA